jgi:hypothetical protein
MHWYHSSPCGHTCCKLRARLVCAILFKDMRSLNDEHLHLGEEKLLE